MKYVMRFHCADFFIDETVLGGSNTNPSPLIDIIKAEIRAENEKKKQLLEKLNESDLAYEKIIELSEALAHLNNELEVAELRWLTLQEKI